MHGGGFAKVKVGDGAGGVSLQMTGILGQCEREILISRSSMSNQKDQQSLDYCFGHVISNGDTSWPGVGIIGHVSINHKKAFADSSSHIVQE